MRETNSAVLSSVKFRRATCFLYVDLSSVDTAGLQSSNTHTRDETMQHSKITTRLTASFPGQPG